MLSKDQLVLVFKQYDLASANKKIDLTNPPCLPTSKILGEILRRHPLCFALTASASVLWIYIQQVWHTLKLDDSKEKFKFFIDEEELTFLVDDFQTLFQLPQANDNNHAEFVEPPELPTMLAFLNELGYAKQDRVDEPLLQMMQIIIPPRFTKIIVDHIFTEHPDIPKRTDEPYHKFENDKFVKSIFNSMRNEDPGVVVNEGDEADKELQVQEHVLDENIEKIMEGEEDFDANDMINNQEDPDTRIDPGSHKESPKAEKVSNYITNDEEVEEELADVALIKGQGRVEETLKIMVPKMVNETTDQNMRDNLLMVVIEGIMLEREKTKVDIALMVADAMRKEHERTRDELSLQVSNDVATNVPP
ncbi:hypothetical protein Tco_0595516 [Tanacetum coccineum]